MPKKRIEKLQDKKVATGEVPATAADTQSTVFDYLRKKEMPYEEKTMEEYQKKIQSLSYSQLQRHAIEVANVIPNIERHRLIDRLEREYAKRSANFEYKYNTASLPKTNNMDEARAQNIIKILNGGR